MNAHAEIVRRHLDRLAAGGRIIQAWWRDDDAVAATPALDRLLRVAAEAGVPVTLAVIPGRLQLSLPERLRDQPGVEVAVHGLVHANHAPSGRKPAEFGADRPLATLQAELAQARSLARTAFPQALDLFVPPWNRAADELPAALARTGFRALSAFGGPSRPDGAVDRIPTHLDPVDWHGGGGLLAPDRLDGQLRRTLDDATDVVGVLTHHLCFDEALWSFTIETLRMLSGHPAVRWRRAGQLMRRATAGRTARPALARVARERRSRAPGSVL